MDTANSPFLAYSSDIGEGKYFTGSQSPTQWTAISRIKNNAAISLYERKTDVMNRYSIDCSEYGVMLIDVRDTRTI